MPQTSPDGMFYILGNGTKVPTNISALAKPKQKTPTEAVSQEEAKGFVKNTLDRPYHYIQREQAEPHIVPGVPSKAGVFGQLPEGMLNGQEILRANQRRDFINNSPLASSHNQIIAVDPIAQAQRNYDVAAREDKNSTGVNVETLFNAIAAQADLTDKKERAKMFDDIFPVGKK